MISDTFHHTSTRAEGIEAREKLLQLLETQATLELDFAHTQTTVSFIDECLGVLAEKMGKADFNQKIILKNISPTLKSLLAHIMTRRLNN
jgi:hypothetical protein